MQCHSFLTLRKISFSYLVLRSLAACRLGSARALGWCACVHTCALLKWPPLPVPYEQKNALALQRSSFRENPTYFLTSVGSWVCELVFDAIYDWRSEFSHNRQNDTQDNYSNPRCACAPRVNKKALKCKPSALIFGRGRAKELLHVRDDLRKRMR